MYYINKAIGAAVKEKGAASISDFAHPRDCDALCMWRDCEGNFHIETTESDASKIAEMAKEGEAAILSGGFGIYHKRVTV